MGIMLGLLEFLGVYKYSEHETRTRRGKLHLIHPAPIITGRLLLIACISLLRTSTRGFPGPLRDYILLRPGYGYQSYLGWCPVADDTRTVQQIEQRDT